MNWLEVVTPAVFIAGISLGAFGAFVRSRWVRAGHTMGAIFHDVFGDEDERQQS